MEEDLRWFRTYWFDHNHDPARLAVLEAYAGRQATYSPVNR